MRYGHFDDETPRVRDLSPRYALSRGSTTWALEEYFGIISNTAGGYSFYRDARLRRISRYRYNNAPFDLGGRYIYLRDDATARAGRRRGSRLRPPSTPTSAGTACPTRRIAASHERHPGRDRSTASLWERPWRCGGSGWPTCTGERRPLSVFSSVEFCLWDAQDDGTNFQRNFSTGEVEVEGSVIYHKTEYRERRNHFAYFACSEPLAGFDTAAGRLPRPLPGIRLAPSRWSGGAPATRSPTAGRRIGSHHVRLELGPREEREIVFVLGYWENPRLPRSSTRPGAR